MSEIVDYYMEIDDDTYDYGNLMYKVRCVNGVHIEPYMREEENKKLIHFYRDKRFIVIYVNDIITEIIFTMTSWSDDVQAFYLCPNGISYKFYEIYHGSPRGFKECNDDFNEFIDKNNLRR